MAIARAIERITKRAQQGGLIAVLTGLGEALRDEAIPTPLRRVARRLATLLDGQRTALATHDAHSHTDAPAIVVNVAVAVAVGADPSESEGSERKDKPVVATAVAMSPGCPYAHGEPPEPDEPPTEDEDPPEDPDTAWRSGLAPRA